MPFGPGGTFTAISLPGSFNPADAGQQATPEAWNALLADLTSAGLSQTITKNGLTTPTANLPMGGFRWTGVGDATARTMFASAGQVQDNALAYGTAGGTADAATLTLSPAILTYKAGQIFSYLAPGTTTITNPELNVNGLGDGVIVQAGGGALPVGAIISGGLTTVAVIDAATPVFQLLVGRAPLSTAGGTLTGTLTMSGAAINEAARVDVASATTTDIGAAVSNYVRITGSVTITGMGTIGSGAYRNVLFAASPLLTHNATSLILPTGANITPAAGDTAGFISEGSGNWRCLWYQRANGAPLSVNTPYAEYTTYSTFAPTIPGDNSIPQVGEGTQILSVAITPSSSTNKVRVSAQAPLGLGSGGSPDTACMALFRNGGTNAIDAKFIRLLDGAATYPAVILFEDSPGATTAQTYTIRVGANSANISVNGVAAGRLGGGSSRASITLEEIPV